MSCSKLDRIYRSILFSKYFIKGWGSPENLKKLLEFRKCLSSREECFQLVRENYPIVITKDKYQGNSRIIEGNFYSPFDFYLPGILPDESKNANFQVILPREWSSQAYRPVCMHLAGTGDHYFWRRRHLMAKPLLREAGIGSILLENPFYGTRKPTNQRRSALHNVSDIFVMGGCLILEGLVLLNWCKKQGFGPLGISGLSMGGYMACIVATNWPYPLVLVPCLCSSTASGVFIEGVMSRSINWDLLQCQYNENDAFKNEIQRMVSIKNTDAFWAGKELVRRFPESLSKLEGDESDPSEVVRSSSRGMFSSISKSKLRLSLSEWATKKTAPYKVIQRMQEKMLKYPDRPRLDKLFRMRCSPQRKDRSEAVNFMRGIMDEFTDLKNFSMPVDTSLVISICARDDGYVPCRGFNQLTEIWPGAQVRFIDAGHISAFIMHQREFRAVIIEAFQRYLDKYLGDESGFAKGSS